MQTSMFIRQVADRLPRESVGSTSRLVDVTCPYRTSAVSPVLSITDDL